MLSYCLLKMCHWHWFACYTGIILAVVLKTCCQDALQRSTQFSPRSFTHTEHTGSLPSRNSSIDSDCDCNTNSTGVELDEKYTMFKGSVHRSFEKHKRQRRANPDVVPSWSLEAQDPLPVGNASILKHFYYQGENYLIAGLSQSDGIFEQRAVIYQWIGGTFVDSGYHFITYGVADIQTFFISGKVYIAVANKQFANDDYDSGSYLMTFEATPDGVTTLQTILTHGGSCIDIFDFDGQTYMLISNFITNTYSRYESELRIYEDSGMHFDRILSESTYGATCVISFKYNSYLYIVVGQYIDNDGNYDVGSPLYKFDTETLELQKIETLSTSGVVDMKLFRVDFEIYLAIANNRKGPVGQESLWTSSVIYWWSGNQFVEYQTIRTFGAQKWEFLQLGADQFLLFLVHSMTPDSITIYEYNDNGDWTEASTQISLPGEQLSSTNNTGAVETFEIAEQAYVIVSRMDLASHDFSIQKSNFYRFIDADKNATIVQTDTLSECLVTTLSITNFTSNALAGLGKILDTTMSKTKNQQVNASLVIDGNVIVDGTMSISDLTVRNKALYNIDPAVIAQIEDNDRRLKLLQAELEYVVTLFGNEVIQGYTVFQSPVTVRNTLSGNASTSALGGQTLSGELDPLPLNFVIADVISYSGVIDISDIASNAIYLSGNQTVYELITIGDDLHMWGNLSVGGTLNGLKIPDDLLTVSEKQEISGVITFGTDVTFYDNITLLGNWNGLNLETDVVMTKGPFMIGGFKEFIQDVAIESSLSVADDKTVDEVDFSEFQNEVLLLSTGGHLSGNMTFLSPTFMEDDLTLGNHMINDLKISELAEQLVLVDTIQDISASKLFEQNLSMMKNLVFSSFSLLNSLDPSEDLVPIATEQIISTPVNVSDDVTVNEHVIVTGLVNGIDLSEEVVLVTGNQTITGLVNFTNDVGIIGNLDIKPGSTMDGVDVSELNQTAARVSGMQEIWGMIIFKEDVFIDNIVSVDGFVNGINITQLDEDVLSKSRMQVIPGNKAIDSNLTITGDMIVNGTMDGLRVSDFVLVSEHDTITGHKTFTGPFFVADDIIVDEYVETNEKDLSDFETQILKVNGNQTLAATTISFLGNVSCDQDVTIVGYLNGWNVTQDFVSLDDDEEVKGKKTFVVNYLQCVSINSANIVVNGTVQNIGIGWFYQETVLNNTNCTIYGRKTFEDLEVLEDLTVEGEIDGVALSSFLASVILLGNNQTVASNLTYLDDLLFNSEVTITSFINDIDLSEVAAYVIYKDTNEEVFGIKGFRGEVALGGNLQLVGYLDGVYIDELFDEYLSKSQEQTVYGTKIFNNSIHVGNLYLNESALLDGISIIDLVLTSANANFSATVHFVPEVKFGDDLVVEGLVSDVEILLLYTSVVWRDSPSQVVAGFKNFVNVVVIGNITIDGMVNGIDVSELGDSIIDQDENNTITVPVVFYGPVKILGNWNMSGLFHEIDIGFLMRDAMLVEGDQVVAGDKHFTVMSYVTIQELIFQSDLRVDILSEDISFYWLLNNTVLASTDQVIEGSVTFENNIILIGHLNIDGTIDGVDLSENAVLIAGAQEIMTSTTMRNGFHVEGNLTVTGLVDMTDLERLENIRVTLSTEQVIEGLWYFEMDLYVLGDMYVNNKINDIHPVNDVVYHDGNHTITGRKVFTGNVTVQASSEIWVVNGIDLRNLSTVVLRRGSFNILGEIFFDINVTFLDNTKVTGFVDDIDVSSLWWATIYVSNKIARSLTYVNDSIRDQCHPIYSLNQAREGLAHVFVYFDEVEEFDNGAITRVDTALYGQDIFMTASETFLSSVDRCIHTNFYICPKDKSGCVILMKDLRPSQSVELYAFQSRMLMILTPSQQSATCTGPSNSRYSVVLDVHDHTFLKKMLTPGGVYSKTFEVEGALYMAVARYEHPKTGDKSIMSNIFQFNITTESFNLHQKISTNGAKTMSCIRHNNETWLAVANSNGETYSRIYQWSNGTKQFSQSASILTNHASDVLLFTIDDTLYAAFANEMTLSTRGVKNVDQPITLYAYRDESGWQRAQYLETPQTVDLDYFTIDDVVYLVAVSGQGYLYIFQWTGAAQFKLYKSFPVTGARHVHSFMYGGELYLAVARPAYSTITSDDIGKTTLIRAVTRGYAVAAEIKVT